MAKETSARKSAAGDLVALLRTAGKPEMEALDREIAGVDEKILALKVERAALQQARNLVSFKLNGSTMGNSKANTKQRQQRLEAVFKYLTDNGAAMVQAISLATEIPKGSVHALLKHEWFNRGSDGWEVAKTRSKDPSVGN